MPDQPQPIPLNNKATIISMAVLAVAASSLLHEGLGHGVTAWLRGDIPPSSPATTSTTSIPITSSMLEEPSSTSLPAPSPCTPIP